MEAVRPNKRSVVLIMSLFSLFDGVSKLMGQDPKGGKSEESVYCTAALLSDAAEI
jgi:hypothetical protein